MMVAMLSQKPPIHVSYSLFVFVSSSVRFFCMFVLFVCLDSVVSVLTVPTS